MPVWPMYRLKQSTEVKWYTELGRYLPSLFVNSYSFLGYVVWIYWF
jgi:hypothetical protein